MSERPDGRATKNFFGPDCVNEVDSSEGEGKKNGVYFTITFQNAKRTRALF